MWTMKDLLREFGPTHRWRDTTVICLVLARHGQLDMLKEARRLGADWDEHTTHDAVMAGSLECLRYAIENGCPCFPNLIDQTLMEDKADILEYLVSSPGLDSKYRVNDELWMVWHTVHYDQPECLKVLLENSCFGDRHACASAAIEGRTECLKLLIETGHLQLFSESTTAWMMSETAENGYLQCLQLLHQAGCEIDVSTCAAAEKGKNDDCMQFTNDKYITKWTETVFKSAAATRIQEWWLEMRYKPNGVMCHRAKRSFEKNNDSTIDQE